MVAAGVEHRAEEEGANINTAPGSAPVTERLKQEAVLTPAADVNARLFVK